MEGPMAKQKIFYECEFCNRLFDEEGQATECETHHAEMVHLKVIDCIDVNVDACVKSLPSQLC